MTRFCNPFQLPGRWLRGNTHCHTTRSDGVASVEERCAQYADAGYDFLVLTDHDVTGPVPELSRRAFLPIPGVELHPANPYGGDVYHIVGVNVLEPIPARELTPQETLAAVAAQGGLAILVHPYWSGHLLMDYEPLGGQYVGLEVYNNLAGQLNGTHNAELIWDAHLDRLGPVWGVAADDAHGGLEHVAGAWVMVRAEELTVPAVVQALARGAFYATRGPVVEDLQVQAEAERITVSIRCSPVAYVRFKGRTCTGRVVRAEPGQSLTEASYTCTGDEKYLRVEIGDAEGRQAWTNPVFLADVRGG